MKTLKYLLVPALTGLLFVACNTEPKGPSQAELDVQVEAKVKAASDQLKADCDSRIMQNAQMKADSAIAKMSKSIKKVVAPAKPQAPTTPEPSKTKTKVKTPPPPVKIDPKKDKMNGGQQAKDENLKDKNEKMQGKEPSKEEILNKKNNKMNGK